MNAKDIVYRMLDEDEIPPEHYLSKLPPRFDRDKVLDLITQDTGWCMDDPSDRRAFMRWVKENENLFPDVALAQQVIAKNDSWCTDNDDDMEAFFAAIGFPRTDPTCPRCDGSGEEPGAPRDFDADGYELVARCSRCHGTGKVRTHA